MPEDLGEKGRGKKPHQTTTTTAPGLGSGGTLASTAAKGGFEIWTVVNEGSVAAACTRQHTLSPPTHTHSHTHTPDGPVGISVRLLVHAERRTDQADPTQRSGGSPLDSAAVTWFVCFQTNKSKNIPPREKKKKLRTCPARVSLGHIFFG